jgi:DNA-binding GntR family transcriptional regulator
MNALPNSPFADDTINPCAHCKQESTESASTKHICLHLRQRSYTLPAQQPKDRGLAQPGVQTQGVQPQERRAAHGRVVAREPIHEQILPHIRQDIVDGRWKPGERLAEPELCEAFGVSRTPLRDAFKILEMEGLVRLLLHVGAVVTPLDPPDLMDKLDVLTGLEQVAAAKIAAMQDRAVLRRILTLHRAMADAAKRGQSRRYYGLNDEFHAAIVRGAGNDTLTALHATMMWHVFRARRWVNEIADFAPDAAEHHERIVQAILDADPDGASLAMRRHLSDVAQGILARLRQAKTAAAPTQVT